MDREEAKIILSSRRAGKDSPESDALLEQALARMEDDAELAEWFAEHCAMDDAMRGALGTIVPPAGLKEEILAAAKVTPLPVGRRRWSVHPAWLAAAAVVALAVGLSLMLPARGGLTLARMNEEIPRLTPLHDHGFGSETGNIEEVRKWLAANGGTGNFEVPQGLKGRGAVGCEVASIEGTKVTILCFHLEGREPAHLYVVNRGQVSPAPPERAADFSQDGEFAVASWSEGNLSYFLALRGNEDEVRGLL